MTLKEIEDTTGIPVIFRSCWNCNSAHKRLKKMNDVIIFCFECNCLYYNGKEIDINKIQDLKILRGDKDE